jgi:hypothetical protein
MTADDRAEIEAALENEEAEELLGIVIDIALAAEDLAWAESCLLRLALHPDTDVRGNALMAFAQLSARLGEIDRARVAPALAAGLGDEAVYVREQAEACLEELGWNLADGE